MITDIRLSISEASKLFGISQRTIRRAIAANAFDFTLVQGRYKISFDSLLRWSQTSSLTIQKRDNHGIGQYVSAWKISTTPLASQTNIPPSAENAAPSKAPVRPKIKAAVQPTSDPVEPTLSWD